MQHLAMKACQLDNFLLLCVHTSTITTTTTTTTTTAKRRKKEENQNQKFRLVCNDEYEKLVDYNAVEYTEMII
ncbi:hypothetical protein DERF_003278 [Dermatophagoides farinae]|uniref:Uncharacterized protein n=1 Tax=Dermatophagoides farinae TaxID=6954 RepID=A0A922LAE9_DERFA|nr:hypothetical protein DERF_003278 [Dermatophagoides farinae]